jgi:hypothetical protein
MVEKPSVLIVDDEARFCDTPVLVCGETLRSPI